jgi:tetratricopeptide (TPR) repeat protein
MHNGGQMHRKLIASLLAFFAAQFISGCVNPSVVAYGRGKLYQNNNDYKQAIEEYTSAIHFDPNLADAYLERANCYAELKQWDKSITDLNLVIQKEADNESAYFSRGWCYENKENYAEAASDFAKAIELKPHEGNNHLHRGWCLLQMDRTDDAITEYSQAIKLEPDKGLNYHYRATAYRYKGDYQAMYKDLVIASKKDPHEADVYYSLAWAAYFTNRLNEVAPAAKNCLELDGWDTEDAVQCVLLANIADRKLGKTDDARMTLTLGLSRCDKTWPYPLLEYYDGKISKAKVFDVNDQSKLCQAKLYAGIDALLKGKTSEAEDLLVQADEEFEDEGTLEQILTKLELTKLHAKTKGKHS